jgi:hypothetical protein
VLSFAFVGLKSAFSDGSGGKIDLFTQKEPYSGIGPNMPSDAFGPEEVVVLYALVSYNEIPVQNSVVTFHVKTPSNMTFTLSKETNQTGHAAVNFTMPSLPENASEGEVFGEWHVTGSVLIEAVVLEDVLTFKVDWIVKLISVTTVNASLDYHTFFGRNGMVGLEITLKNVAMTVKVTTISLVMQDSVGVIVNSSEIKGFQVQANERLVTLYCALEIPNQTYVGNATIFATALRMMTNESRIAYSPSVSTEFFVRPDDPLNVSFHDVAVVDVFPSASLIEPDQSLSVSVVVQNEGTEAESLNVSAYFGDTLIETEISPLLPYSSAVLDFSVDASVFGVGNHSVSAFVTPVLDEADLSDNSLVDGLVEIEEALPILVHDVAVLNVSASSTSVDVGDTVSIQVVVKNQGNYTESFDVTVVYDSTVISTLNVADLGSDSADTLVLDWDTNGVLNGSYTLSATASSVLDEIDLENNQFVDGVIELKVRSRDFPSWIWLLLAYLALLAFILFFYVYERRKRKQRKNSASSQLKRT